MRKPVDSPKTYRELIAGKKLNNNGFFPFEVRKYIDQNRLDCVDLGEIVFLFFDEVTYEQVVIYASEISPDAPARCALALGPQGDIPSACNIVFRSKDDPQAQRLSALVKELGFQLEYVNREHALLDVGRNAVFPPRRDSDIQVSRATVDYADEIQALWAEGLPPFVFPHLRREEMQALIESGLVLMATDPSGRLCGAVHYDYYLRRSISHQIVIKKEFRGRGLSNLFTYVWLRQISDAAAAIVWIEERNRVPAKLVEAHGFRKTGKISHQYIRRKEHGTTVADHG